MVQIKALTSDSSLQDSDKFPFQDGSSDATKYVIASDIKNYIWNNPYKFSVHLAANQTGITDSTATKILWDTEKFDSNSNFATNKYTAPVSGFYQINSYVRILSPGNTGASGEIYLYKNGASIQGGGSLYPTVSVGAAVYLSGNISHLVQLTATDYLEIYVWMDVTSSTVTVVGGSAESSFSGFLVCKT